MKELVDYKFRFKIDRCIINLDNWKNVICNCKKLANRYNGRCELLIDKNSLPPLSPHYGDSKSTSVVIASDKQFFDGDKTDNMLVRSIIGGRGYGVVLGAYDIYADTNKKCKDLVCGD